MKAQTNLCICAVLSEPSLLAYTKKNVDEVEGSGQALRSLATLNNCMYIGLVATKPVFGVSDKVIFKLACSATETS